MTRRTEAEQAARAARVAAIRGCRRCDPCGWLLGADGAPVEPAVRCDHGAAAAQPPSDVRDITEPIYRSDP
ncbi:hypothetical protein [Mycobacterium sp. 29Ha]|uniref:hypothetical protein n=1 Tax=Mycobacterium sp. 29Ha TaxID=2939268 RepID=UPI0029394C19|nr:hypothetical protein [Mycobacterium sp. 29Ha]MDV3136754.1 hypothetical protein [Mycobacterium sp. 29Ha]